jgi:hypothetical protein
MMLRMMLRLVASHLRNQPILEMDAMPETKSGMNSETTSWALTIIFPVMQEDCHAAAMKNIKTKPSFVLHLRFLVVPGLAEILE